MKRQFIIIAMATSILMAGCKNQSQDQNQSAIPESTVNNVIKQLTEKYGESQKELIEKGVKQMANLWNKEDGDVSAFETFCMENYVGDPAMKQQVFERLCKQFESIGGGFNKMTVSLQEPIHMVDYEELPIDEMFGAWSPSAHWESDFFANKLAFYVMLNFPFYTLEEKNKLGERWDNLQ